MITLQVFANVFACANIYLLANGHTKLGCMIGLPGQFLWLYLFWHHHLPYLMFTDMVIATIYIHKLWQLRGQPIIGSRFRRVSL